MAEQRSGNEGRRLTRREALRALGVLAAAAPGAGTLLAACGGMGSGGGTGGGGSSGGGKRFDGQTLVVTSYGGTWQEFMQSDHIPDFEERTGAKVQLAVGLAKDWFAKMQAAGKSNPPYDVFVANETYLAQLRAEGFFVALPADKIPNLKDVAKHLRQPSDVGVLGLVGPLGITYNTEKVKNPPKSWKDLGKYGAKTAIFTIGNSGEPQHVMKMAEILSGNPKDWQSAVSWIGKNLCGAKQVDFSGTEQTMLTQGEVDVGIIDSPDWALLKSKGLPMAWVKPKEGYCGMFEQDMNVTSGSKVKDLAFAFIDYWLSVEVQKKWAEKFYWTPANQKVQIDKKLRSLIPVTRDQFDEIPKWDYVWLNSSGAREKMTDAWSHSVTGHC